jgi:uncharacterized protein YqiB (DUF1249 family)
VRNQFAQLRRLLPRTDAAAKGELSGGQRAISVNDRRIDPLHYLVAIEQTVPAVSYWSLPSMTVRLYHDAMVAEVCSSQQIFRFKARYDYPNKKLHQRDEKHQINQFLADWLRYCLAHGAMAIPVC